MQNEDDQVKKITLFEKITEINKGKALTTNH